MNDELDKDVEYGSEEDRDLTNALQIFFHYGYRKTSLDDLAQAIGVSRQTLYVRYKNKKNIFQLVMINMMESLMRQCETAAKEDNESSIQDKLLRLVDLWHGKQYRNLQSSAHSAEIIDESMAMIGDVIEEKQKAYVRLLEKILKKGGVPAKPNKKVSAFSIAEMLYYTNKGIGFVHEERDTFLEQARKAIDIVCES